MSESEFRLSLKARLDAERRYCHDPQFHALVTDLGKLIRDTALTREDLIAAVGLALDTTRSAAIGARGQRAE